MFRLNSTLRLAFSPNGQYDAPIIRAITINDENICLRQPNQLSAPNFSKNIATTPWPQISEVFTTLPIRTTRIPIRTTTTTIPIQNTPISRIPPTTAQTTQKECTAPTRYVVPRVSNGDKVPDRYYPWHVSIFKTQDTSSMYICGGSIIRPEYILTAAHCLFEENKAIVNSRLFIRAGSNFRESGDYYGINHKEIHNTYDFITFKSDIALLQTKNEIRYNRDIRPICYTATDFKFINEEAWVICFELYIVLFII